MLLWWKTFDCPTTQRSPNTFMNELWSPSHSIKIKPQVNSTISWVCDTVCTGQLAGAVFTDISQYATRGKVDSKVAAYHKSSLCKSAKRVSAWRWAHTSWEHAISNRLGTVASARVHGREPAWHWAHMCTSWEHPISNRSCTFHAYEVWPYSVKKRLQPTTTAHTWSPNIFLAE